MFNDKDNFDTLINIQITKQNHIYFLNFLKLYRWWITKIILLMYILLNDKYTQEISVDKINKFSKF